ncbi:DUF3667 domain-containing protein [Psychroflexus gondwanensis]|jgi:hypothetical protein|uniref:DUF3667 domain-containing protein n=1 Tax=Psychroflexus gondwanensis TaxID=251 RepID=UPI0011BD68E4|nr:DUF3667 domain-containing protein [Psychroflexus gondwanensis]TXE15848.1 DUF3667 domain-containing protein [Psychroflexus gondwanensis]
MSDVSKDDCSERRNRINLKRIDGHYVLQEIRSVVSFEKGFLFTLKELATNPGESVKEFLNKDRKRLVKPIVFLIFTSLIYSVLNSLLSFEGDYMKFSGENDSAVLTIFEWIQGNYGYTNIVMAIFIGFWTKLFFRKYRFNIFEILVLLCFVMGFGMLIFSIFGILEAITSNNIMQIAGIVGFVYTTWAIGQFYGKRKTINYIKAFFAYTLGMLTFAISAILIGTAIDLLL